MLTQDQLVSTIPLIRAICIHFRLDQDIDDVVQSVCERAWRSRGIFRIGQDPEKWLSRMAFRICLDHIDYERLRNHLPIEDFELAVRAEQEDGLMTRKPVPMPERVRRQRENGYL